MRPGPGCDPFRPGSDCRGAALLPRPYIPITTRQHVTRSPRQSSSSVPPPTRPGEEWNTGGADYGESSAPPNNCPNEAPWLSNPVHFSMGFTRVRPSNDGGDERSDWGYYLAAHPRVSEVEVTVDRDQPFVVRTVALPARPDGPRFAGFTVAYDARTVTVNLLDADGQVLSAQTTRPAG